MSCSMACCIAGNKTCVLHVITGGCLRYLGDLRNLNRPWVTYLVFSLIWTLASLRNLRRSVVVLHWRLLGGSCDALILLLCLLLESLLACREWLSDDCQSSFSASDQKEPSILRNNESEYRLDQIVGRNIDSLQWGHERQLSDDNIATFSSVDEPFHEISILYDLWCHNLAALLRVVLGEHFWVFLEIIKVLPIDWERDPDSVYWREHS